MGVRGVRSRPTSINKNVQRKKWLCCNYICDRSFGTAAKFICIHKFVFRAFVIVIAVFLDFTNSIGHARPFFATATSTWKFTTICELIHYQRLWNASEKNDRAAARWNSFEYVAAFDSVHFVLRCSSHFFRLFLLRLVAQRFILGKFQPFLCFCVIALNERNHFTKIPS